MFYIIFDLVISFIFLILGFCIYVKDMERE